MKSQIYFEKNKNKFHFAYSDHDPELEREANLKLLKLLALAPPGAEGIGTVEKTVPGYVSTVTIRSSFRSFTTKAMGSNAKNAVHRALEKLENELFSWRFGGGSGNFGDKQSSYENFGSPMQTA